MVFSLVRPRCRMGTFLCWRMVLTARMDSPDAVEMSLMLFPVVYSSSTVSFVQVVFWGGGVWMGPPV